MKIKPSKKFRFTEEEKQKLIDKYYNEYYVDEDVKEDEFKVVVLDPYDTMIKRDCACHVGTWNEKTGTMVPPKEIEISKHRKEKTMLVPNQQTLVNKEMLDAQLGNSEGIRTKLDKNEFNLDLDDIL